jgi:2-deoxy-D-gluconate 3-dehydrogenase
MSTLNVFDLTGKTAIVTGASTGIGQGIAKGLADAGADIIAMSRHKEGEDTTKTYVTGLGRKYKHYDTDFSDRANVYESIKQIKADWEKIDILFSNAGTIFRKPLAEHSDENWDEVIEINLNSNFILAREIGKEMLKRKYGKIIFTCSLLSFQGGVTVPGYAASKGGVARLVNAFANEWASQGINVNGIAPGYINTPLTVGLREDAARSKTILDRIPAGRWGTPEDFVGPAILLASDASSYMHGSIITIDGGWMGR